jgi:chorismate mutase
MSEINYFLVNADILPEVYTKVIQAKGYIASGEATSASQAAKMAGISRSAYYKYKDKIFEYSEKGEDTATINAKLIDNAGVLSSVMNELYLFGANVLSVNQSIPVNSVADVSITVKISQTDTTNEQLLEKIKKVSGVKFAEIV